MPDRPLLILPTPDVPTVHRKKTGGGGKVKLPTRSRQEERITPRLTVLQQALEARRARVQTETTGIVPEEVVVLETVQPVQKFAQAVSKIEGLEWLGEIEEEDIPPDDDFFALNKKGVRREDKALRGRLFLILTNQQALQQLLSLWNAWKSGQKLNRGLAKWGEVFARLRDVRPWGVHDRLVETGVLDDWRERVEHGEEVIPCEVELWFRRDLKQRQSTRDRITSLVGDLKGEVLKESTIEEIAYHALLLRIPIAAVQQLLEEVGRDAALVQCEQIQFFRAAGQMAGIIVDDARTADPPPEKPAAQLKEPVVALLDGLPIQNHQRLTGRLVVDDPDGLEAQYPANERRHGTAMASLIIHGDLDGGEQPLPRRLYVRPILCPDPHDWHPVRREMVSESTLIVDLVHRAVRRLFEGTGDEKPVAPQVCVINLSIGILDRLFDGTLSPMARLLDWLAWRYKVLFVVSAGNHNRPLELPLPRGKVSTLRPKELQAEVIKAVAADARHRRLLSPAEAVNVLTVGALHEDSCTTGLPPNVISPYVDQGLPSPINAQGMGYRRAIKPDLLLPGGRMLFRESLKTTTNTLLEVPIVTCPPGNRVAAPGTVAGDVSSSWHIRGTSDAAALASRSAAVLYEVLQELRDEPGGEMVTAVPPALWLKVLLVHSASWGSTRTIMADILRTEENSHQFREYLTRLLGYGASNLSRVRECTEHRVTSLSGGTLTVDQSHVHRFPLPPSLSGQVGHRRLVISLAWMTPINASHQAWRRADLWFHPDPERPPKSKDPLTKLPSRQNPVGFSPGSLGKLA